MMGASIGERITEMQSLSGQLRFALLGLRYQGLVIFCKEWPYAPRSRGCDTGLKREKARHRFIVQGPGYKVLPVQRHRLSRHSGSLTCNENSIRQCWPFMPGNGGQSQFGADMLVPDCWSKNIRRFG
ncbi:predicted protein [Brucella abortus bv. 4 str. 292]|uniref:Uncharacterized protein n=1 Tax=Brucella abortus (strain 2308) TaxID=359391 RepID=Q2YQE1_BRUA2|nr:predicted protein [Brucella abortus bv. 4 str. 292]EEX59379.1 predicted protein [Brucella abortus bv. 2 str. 86/8/59]EEX62011.1 predicted protein [Brucella abortus bv. 6 str. 870]EEX80691.1 conserved hypothetical protein [Brucella abortus bv. 9 str. C68]EEX82807.1 predicted protein [Brucella abortus bv. 3 str. Tulya]EFH35156.1 hypothetical protein BAYG_01604 [Brucella abortus bv. 5 str. B3196]CAJ11331.1 conserved hypothetical protein [Brucella abortus 2308]SHO31141.1 Protein with unknown 